ncbi:hypothetical protein KCTC32516_02120 [Polaribacter huanghezhanensis]|uniref:hypothetical protein n=1 Tax=Polaribacter huanghezhanensis TaxID=1354726 RepID=UPI00264703D3|nr:hypothetical protein [Polaribacter huanghezhanensis]WKD86742.1 hypothetical protein KCTC32516_02120 [Polaribacter huanghezhanensis]
MKLKNVIIILFFLLQVKNCFSQKEKEQLAFDYFMEKIFPKDYKGFTSKSVFFNGLSESKKDISGSFGKCFDEDFKEFFYDFKKVDINNKVKIKINNYRFSKRKKPKYFYMKIFRSVNYKGFDYIYISLYKKDKFYVDHYIVKIENKKIIDHCYVNEIF